jgi:hypothetical protein
MDQLCRLDAQGMGNIFQVGLGGYLTLKDIDLRNGVCTQGGAVLVSGSGTTITTQVAKFVALNVHFFNNTATVSNPILLMNALTRQPLKDSHKKLRNISLHSIALLERRVISSNSIFWY